MLFLTINFEKLQKHFSELPEREFSKEEKRYREIIIMLSEAETAGEVDYGSFTMEELDAAYEMLEDLSPDLQLSYSIVEEVRNFESLLVNTDVF